MSDRLFFVDKNVGTQKTYRDFVQDVNAIQSVPSIYASADQYALLTHLVAALCCDQDIALSQRALVEPLADSKPIPVCPQLEFARLWATVSKSKSKIGIFTSGTTGRERLIHHRIESLVRTVRISPQHQQDIWGLTYHPASFAGLQVMLQALCNGNSLVRLSGLDSTAVHDEIRDMKISHLSATPTWIRLLCSDGVVHDGVRHITTGGEIADRSLMEQAHHRFPNATFKNIYASTESGSVLVSDGDLFRVPADLSDKVRVEAGVLAIHRSLLAESLQSDDATEFYVTGDCVEIVSESPLTIRFLARRDDWINVGGNKVNPHEVERLLVALHGVADARVFGRKNSVTGSIVCCEIVRSVGSSITQADIRKAMETQVESYMVPRFIGFVEAIEKTPTGKKSRTE